MRPASPVLQRPGSAMTSLKLYRRLLLGCVLAASGTALWAAASAAAQSRSNGTGTRAPEGVSAALLPITSEITDVTVESVKRRIDEARRQGVGTIILDLDTPGGLVTSSIAVADLIKNLEGIRTIAWVHPNAHSGGTIVAVACDEIVMAKSSRMGDSQVIFGGPTGVGAVPEELQPKAYTPVLAEFRASCRLRGYDQNLCEAFVLPEREVWWIEHTKTGERRFVFREEKEKLIPEVKPATPPKAEKPVDGKDEPDAPSAAAPITEPASDWKLVIECHDPVLDMVVKTRQPIVPSDQLLEMSAGEAQAYGFSKGIVTSESDLRNRYNLGSIVQLAPLWSESLALWMTSMWVRGFLLVIILLGAYVEFHTPGVGVPGLVALICLAIFVAAPYLTGLANVWEILCLIMGMVLIALELFVIPGFGVAGITGIGLVIVGLVATFVPEEPGRSFPIYLPSLPGTVSALKAALLTVVSAMATSLIGMVMLSRFLPRLPVLSRIVPANPTPSDVLVEDPYHGAARVGDVGLALGPLRPAGKARFSGTLVDAVTQGEYIEPGTRVEIIEQRGNRVVVRAVS